MAVIAKSDQVIDGGLATITFTEEMVSGEIQAIAMTAEGTLIARLFQDTQPNTLRNDLLLAHSNRLANA
jgi:hypothetical protein